MDALWRNKKDRKIKNRSKGQTPGKLKGETCKATTLARYFSKSSRAYKHPEYASWMEKTRKLNKQG